MLHHWCWSPMVLKQLRSATHDLHALATGLADLTRSVATCRLDASACVPSECSEGPDSRPGTYVMILRSEHATVLRIGRLGTFWLPSGFFLYVGSAFGGGGVGARTNRHCCSQTPKMWNLDHIKAIARPVELWWTHVAEKVECPWAMALAELPGYCCPAPRCGGNDCKSCPAHLYHTNKRPSGSAFAEVVRQAIPDHGLIYRQRID
jgi:Uri superfamily endonuclease